MPGPRIRLAAPLSTALTALLYLFSAATVGLAACPSALLLRWGWAALLGGGAAGPGRLLLFCLLAGGALYAFFLVALLLLGLLLRLLSLPLRPGRWPLRSVRFMVWMAASGVQTIAMRLVLPVVPFGFTARLYYRLAGCEIGRDVWMSSVQIMDPFLVRIGDGTVIGGEVVIAPHAVDAEGLSLEPVRIGADCRVGPHTLVCAGVTLGDGVEVGPRSYLRRGRALAAGTRAADLGSLPAREVVRLHAGSVARPRPHRPGRR